jgi:hypothetical protein
VSDSINRQEIIEWALLPSHSNQQIRSGFCIKNGISQDAPMDGKTAGIEPLLLGTEITGSGNQPLGFVEISSAMFPLAVDLI